MKLVDTKDLKSSKHLIFAEDNEGNGLIRFNPKGPQSFPELFKKCNLKLKK